MVGTGRASYSTPTMRDVAFLYERVETSSGTEIVFRRQLLAFGGLLIVYLVTLFVFRVPLVALVLVIVGMLLMVRDRRSIAKEVRAAADDDRLTVSGSQWSLKNPLTYHIHPSGKSRKSLPGAVRKGTPRPRKRKR